MKRVAIVWRGDPRAAPPSRETHRLRGVFDALERRGLIVEGVVYSDDVVDEVRHRLTQFDAALVWIDPITDGRDRSRLDPMLRDLAHRGVVVSAHPDVIQKMGTKDVLYRTRHMGWGSDTRLYSTFAEFRDALPKVLSEGQPRVLKQYRGNGGNGVWKVEAASNAPHRVRVRHALRGSLEEELALAEFIERCARFFEGDGRIIDQVYQPRLVDGIVRCYLVRDRVEGFGEQLINALFPAPVGAPPSEAPQPGPRLYYPPARPDFQRLKHLVESEWVPELCRTVGVGSDDLPLLWDADFMYGPKTPAGDDTYVLCEINVSAVAPFPDSALEPLADALVARLNRTVGARC